MFIEKIHIKGFRNFEDAEISFQKKTLIFGANDVGKTNLLYALRLLFDKNLSEHDLELSDSDYNAYSGTDTIDITVTIRDVIEECLLSVLIGFVKDGTVIIKYTNNKHDGYKIFAGFSEDTLWELPTRQYIKRLNMQYVDTNRDLNKYLKRERVSLLQISKEKLSDEQTDFDKRTIDEIQSSLNSINSQICSLNYISTSLEEVNSELGKLSIHNEDQSVRFVAGESDANKLLDNLVLSYSNGDAPLSLGGDGRNNQIFLATWIAKQHIQESIDHVTFYAIEEPEAHLHPHQQRRLSAYIQDNFDAQIIITTHSPHIASKFQPSCLVRLYMENKYSFAACGGCSTMLKKVIDEFGYRLNSLSTETFFSNGVFLVEGTSEVLFYTALAESLKIDLDRLNISILSVEGIGFKPYIAVCDALKIPWVLRTDNDIFSKPGNAPTKKYYAGISRIMGIIEDSKKESCFDLLKFWNEHKSENEWPKNEDIPICAKMLNNYIREHVNPLGIFISDIDLENDLARSELSQKLLEYYGTKSIECLVKDMQKKKAENMLTFLNDNREHLTLLKNSTITMPLSFLAKTVTERTKPNDKGTNR